MEKKQLKINLDELCAAMDDASYKNEYFLDLQKGEVLLISEYADEGETEELKERIDEDFKRYKRVPKAESNEGYRDMEDFITAADNEHLAELLEVAINGKGAFRRFKDVLLNYPEERERWFQFKNDRMRERAMEWLDDIEATLSEE